MKLFRRALNWIIPAVLLIAQHGALAHLVSHLDAGQPPAQEQSLVHLKLCGKCVSIEKLSHAAAAPDLRLVATEGRFLQLAAEACACVTKAQPAYRSRAPPHLL